MFHELAYSQTVEVNAQVVLRCIPPDGLPPPDISWLKNGQPMLMSNHTNIILSNSGSLIISEAKLADTGNYTCVAQNIAADRHSDISQLTVYSKSKHSC